MIDKVVQEARNYYPRVRAAAEGMEIKQSMPLGLPNRLSAQAANELPTTPIRPDCPISPDPSLTCSPYSCLYSKGFRARTSAIRVLATPISTSILEIMHEDVQLEQETNPWEAQAARFDLAAQS